MIAGQHTVHHGLVVLGHTKSALGQFVILAVLMTARMHLCRNALPRVVSISVSVPATQTTSSVQKVLLQHTALAIKLAAATAATYPGCDGQQTSLSTHTQQTDSPTRGAVRTDCALAQ